jgi:regulator of replication initiation timing
MDNKIKLALQDLHEAIINKIQEVKFLEKKITSLSIENAKLHDEIDKLNKIIIKHQSEERDLDIKISDYNGIKYDMNGLNHILSFIIQLVV